MPKPQVKTQNQNYLEDQETSRKLCPYPVEMLSYLTLPGCAFDPVGIPFYANPCWYHPTLVAQYALAHWNQYLKIHEERHYNIFLAQARWFIEHQVRIDGNAVGWPVPFPHLKDPTGGICLSASAQGFALSVLTRAYQLTCEEVFLEVAKLAAQTFERDILDGGVYAPFGEDGVFFEDAAVYPARHSLKGFIFALFGLYDYLDLTDDISIRGLIERSLSTMHILLKDFDTGFWTYADLLHRQLVTPSELLLHAELLSALATISGCEQCSQLSLRWRGYQRQPLTRLRYHIVHRIALFNNAFWKHLQSRFFPVSQTFDPLRVCVPITAFPVTGGTRTVLGGIVQVTAGRWQVEYQTQRVGPDAANFTIYKFGTAKMSPWQFPLVWFYFFAGLRKLIWLLHHGMKYHIILPQDGVFTGAFAAIAGKLAGVRVVCIDHGNLTLLDSQMYRNERLQALSDTHWVKRFCAHLLYSGYWPSLKLLAKVSARFTDHFLIPGVVGDGVEDVCTQLKIPPSRVTRFNSMIDVEQFGIVDSLSSANMRKKSGIGTDSIVIAMVCRLAPEKGLNVALDSIHQALSQLSPEQSTRVSVIIAGDGPLRSHLEEDICLRGMSKSCILWGEIAKTDVISLLRMSDIFLYTSTRGACMSMAVLEAMASGCAVIASNRPLSNAHLLADGRGIAVPAEDVEQTSQALVRLLNNLELCRHMGRLAKHYVATQHSAAMFMRTLLRATKWSSLDELLKIESKS
jgi:glycosyltransferase involved in cell wall biosynthesis